MTILGRFYEKIEKTMIKVSSKKTINLISIKSLFIQLLELEFYAESNGEVYFLRFPLNFSELRLFY